MKLKKTENKYREEIKNRPLYKAFTLVSFKTTTILQKKRTRSLITLNAIQQKSNKSFFIVTKKSAIEDDLSLNETKNNILTESI